MALYFFTGLMKKIPWLALLSFAFYLLPLLKPTELYIALPMVWLWFRKHLFHFRPWLRLFSLVWCSIHSAAIWYVYACILLNVH